MVAFMDRFFKAGDFAHKPAAVAASARRGGCTAALEVLIKYPTYNQMPGQLQITGGHSWKYAGRSLAG